MATLLGSAVALLFLLALAARLLLTASLLFPIVALAACLPCFLALHCAPRLPWRQTRWLVFGVALLGRLMFLSTPLTLSDDAYRYFWEGRVVQVGLNPYRLAPEAPELIHLRDDHWQSVTHREVPSVYPPLLQAVFLLGAAAGSSPAIFKVIFTGLDLLCLVALLPLLRARGQPESLVLAWAWNPLVIIEFAGNGHEMSLAILAYLAGLGMLTCAGTAGADARRTGWLWFGTGLAFTAAVLSHLLSVPFVLATVLAARVKSGRFWMALGASLVAGLVLWAGVGSLAGFTHVAGRWRFNGSLFEALRWLLRDDSARAVAPGVWLAHERAKGAAALLVMMIVGWTWRRRSLPAAAAQAVGGAVLLLSPVVHPWYVTWLAALGCLEKHPAWLAFTALVLLSYTAKLLEIQTGTWLQLPLMTWLEYLPVFVILIAVWLGRSRP